MTIKSYENYLLSKLFTSLEDLIDEDIDDAETWLKKKLIKKENGIPIFYIVYRPQNELPNVITYHTHPDLRQEEGLDELLKEVADKVRGFYEKHPELLNEVMKSVK